MASKTDKKTVETKVEKKVAKTTAKPAFRSNKLSKQIRKGDMVMVVSGDDKGKSAKVVDFNKKDNKVILEGIMEQTDYQKNKLANVSLGKRIKNAPVHISKIKMTK
jgi:large subunit ribosomal protein L24